MNSTSNIRPIVLDRSFVRIFAAALTCITAHSAILTWDIVPGVVGVGDGAITGGGGTWDLTNGNWTADAGVNNLGWSNGDSAIFQGTGGAVTLGAAISVDDVTFATAGYSITAGTLTLAGTPTITTAADATISSVIDGTSGFTKLGAGQLTLTGANTFTGTTILDNGNLVLGSTTGFAINGAIQMGAGAAGNQPNLRMAANEQFGAGVVMTFVNPNGSFPRFDLQGTTQTLAGVSDATGAGVIQNEKLGGGGTNGPATLKLNSAANFSFNGYMRDRDNGPGIFLLNLVKSGAGTQTLSGPNITYTGMTTVNGGRLELLNGTAFASATTVNSGGILRISNNLTTNPYAPMGGTAAIVVNAGGVLELNNATTGYNNRKTLGGSVSGAGTINVIGTGYLALPSVNNITLSGQINVLSGGLSNDGGASANAFGTTTASLDISSGAFFDLRGGAPQFGGLSGAGLMMNSFTANTLTLGAADKSGVFTGTMQNGGNGVTGTGGGGGSVLSLTKIGTGSQTLGVANAAGSGITYTGATTVNGGTLTLIDARSVATAKTVAAGATLEIHSTIPFSLKWNNSGTISGAGTINKTGSGVFGTTGAVNFSGVINILNGRLHNDNVTGNWTGSTADVNISATGVLDLRANDMYVDELNGTGEIWNSHPAGGGDVLFVGVANGSSSYGGAIMGNQSQAADNPNGAVLSLTKQGTGTFTVTGGANIYSGPTTVNNGVLSIGGGNNRLPVATSLIVNGGATFGGTFDLNAQNQTVSSLTGGSGVVTGVVRNSATGTGTLAINTGGAPQFDGVLQDGGAGKVLALSKLGGGSLTLAGSAANTFTGTTILDNGNLFLSKANGIPAISGNVQMGNGSAGNQPNLRMMANEQFGAGVVMTFVNPFGSFPRFDLQGTTQTLAGVADATGAGVIQNERFGGGGTTGPATLMLNGSGNTSFNGYMRDRDNGPGIFLLNLVKSGTGTQDLVGGNVNYTGTTTVNGGVLHLTGTTAFNSAVTVNVGTFRIQDAPNFNLGTVTMNPTGTLGFRATNPAVDNWVTNFAFTGGYTITKDGAGWFQFRASAPENFGGLIRVEEGRFGNGHNTTVWTNSTADVFVASGAQLDLRTDDMILDELNGSGEVINTFFLGETNNTLTVGVANGSSQYDGIIRGIHLGGGLNNISIDAGRNSLAKVGTGTFTITGANTYVGTTTISGGTLQVGAGGATGNLGTGAVTNNAALIFNRSGASTETASIGGGGTVSKLGTGLVVLPNPSYTGATSVSNGTLAILDGTAWNSDASVASPGVFAVANSGLGTWNFTKAVTGNGTFGKGGAGTVRVLGDLATYSGPTVVENGVLQFNDASAFASSSVTANAGGYFEMNRTSGSQTLSASVGGAGHFTKNGAGELVLGGALSNAGNTSVRAGTLSVGASNQLSASGTLTVGGSGIASAKLNGFSQTIGGLAGGFDTGARVVNGSATPATLTVNLPSGQSVFGGTLGGAGANENNLALIKQGAGTLVFTGQSTHTGGLTISGGTVQLGASTTAPASLASASIWLDGADPAATGTAPADGALISIWKNKGALGATGDFSAVAGFEPSYGATGAGQMNGNATVRFTADSGPGFAPQANYDKLTNPINLASGASTVIVAGRYASADGGQRNRLVTALNNNWLLGWWNNGVNGAYYDQGFVPNISGADTAAHTYSAIIRGDGSTDTYSESGRLGGGGGVGPNGLALGGGYNPATPNTENSTGDVGELIVVQGQLADSERTAIEAYLARKWTGYVPTNPLPTTSTVTLSASGATLAVNGVTQTIATLSGVAGSSITLGGGSLTVGDATSTTFAGAISGNGTFTKVGAGTLTLSSTNTSTGNTLVQGGTLEVTGTLSGSLVEVQTGGTLSGNGTIAADLYITGSGKLAPGTSPGTLTVTGSTLDFSDAVSASNSQTFAFELGTTSDRVNLTTGQLGIGTGVLEFDDFTFTETSGFGPGTYTLFDSTQDVFGTLGASLSGTLVGTLVGTLSLADTNNDIILTVVPEPGSATLILGGLAMLVARRRKNH